MPLCRAVLVRRSSRHVRRRHNGKRHRQHRRRSQHGRIQRRLHELGVVPPAEGPGGRCVHFARLAGIRAGSRRVDVLRAAARKPDTCRVRSGGAARFPQVQLLVEVPQSPGVRLPSEYPNRFRSRSVWSISSVVRPASTRTAGRSVRPAAGAAGWLTGRRVRHEHGHAPGPGLVLVPADRGRPVRNMRGRPGKRTAHRARRRTAHRPGPGLRAGRAQPGLRDLPGPGPPCPRAAAPAAADEAAGRPLVLLARSGDCLVRTPGYAATSSISTN